MSGKKKNIVEYTGTLTRVDRFTTKNGKQILTLCFEETGQWPFWVGIKVFGRLTELSDEWKPGTILDVTGRLGGREYNGKVYPEVIAETVEVVAEGKPAGRQSDGAIPQEPAPTEDSIPF